MSEIGIPISRKEALTILRRILERAEQERIELDNWPFWKWRGMRTVEPPIRVEEKETKMNTSFVRLRDFGFESNKGESQ